MYTDAKPSHFIETAMSYVSGFLVNQENPNKKFIFSPLHN